MIMHAIAHAVSSAGALSARHGPGFPPVDQDYLLQARQMQALSFVVHIPLVCFGIAFPVIILFTQWRYLRTGDHVYRLLAKRWSKVMIALLAVGVVTGTILSFQFGLLWPAFTASFGNVFGLGFALEGFSFFMEAIFSAIYVYGWGRMATLPHMLSGAVVCVTGMTGSFFVISVNAWMNHPSGFTVRDGRAVQAEPWSALFANSYFWHEFVHMYFAAFVVAGFVIAGAYAWGFLRGRRDRYHRTALVIALSIAAVAAPLQVAIGDWAAREVADHQPVKLAALEGLGRTTEGAPEHLGGWYTGGEVKYGIEVPKLLSLLAYHNPDARVQGLETVPPDGRPPVNVVRYAFQAMVGIGTLLALIGVFYLYVRFRRRRLPETPWFYRALIVAGPLSVVALEAGWTATEVGRQPWVVYQVMRTGQAVTGARGVPVGLWTLVVVYLALAGAVAWLLYRFSRVPLEADARQAAPAGPQEGKGRHAR
ncbi:cytochrome ubiquinol oxidase subunit I [Actinomadura macrotermitis]|uniref:Putative cytochrome bd menaquinol oxidase subunit I n=1 Tax=Actinomadura macrotermitis TaxID=2585200 RepID=A0A7K0C8I5_9ACTN|nr:cytochrome ubiquinol oxidase subunit I [Actinomadura macrotermitis]MQY09666.1 putative cytochrome bd menaquinol oxidase subunit I [Actinomadura macrotermitis]